MVKSTKAQQTAASRRTPEPRRDYANEQVSAQTQPPALLAANGKDLALKRQNLLCSVNYLDQSSLTILITNTNIV